MHSRSEHVESIIRKRSSYLPRQINTVIIELRNISSALQHLKRHQIELLDECKNPDEEHKLRAIVFDDIQSRITSEILILEKLKVRFSRHTLNIGVLGLMGQGKSTLLKSFSGLTDREIPAYEGAACTAVRSIVSNRVGSVEVIVAFHSEKTFLEEVIHPYYISLNISPLPYSLDEFAHTSFSNELPEGATNDAIYRNLVNDYYRNLEKYREFLALGTEPQERSIPINEVDKYVRQKRDIHGNITTFSHLAVREVKIFCPFPKDDIGKIALVDIPGLGDSKLGDEKIMLDTLGKAVDVVIFITRPDPQRYQWRMVDTKLYDLASKELNNLRGRAFMVINHSQRTDNYKACEALQNTFELNVVSSSIVDCSNPEDANILLDNVLNYLAENILNIDKLYAQECQKRLKEIQIDIKKISQTAKKVFEGKDNDLLRSIDDKYDDLFGTDQDGWWRDIRIAFQELRFEFAEKSQDPSTTLESSVNIIYKKCKENAGILTSINANEEVEEQIKASNPMKAYADYRDQLRTLLSDHFTELDESLKELIGNLKLQISNILINKGKLGALFETEDNANFLVAFKNLIELEHSDLKRLKQGLDIIDSFELSYNGLIEPQIYQHLIELSNIQIGGEEAEEATLKVSQNTSSDLILTALQVDYDRTVSRIKAATEELLYQPNIAAYARIEKFIDNIIYHKEAQKDWKKFLRRVKDKVWAEEIGILQKDLERQTHWLKSISRLDNFENEKILEFLT